MFKISLRHHTADRYYKEPQVHQSAVMCWTIKVFRTM